MQFTIIQVGKTRPGFLQEAEKEYLKRLKPYARLNVITVKDGKAPHIKEDEAAKILKAVPESSFVIALDEHGKQMTSPELATFIGEKRDKGFPHITFIIGGCYGLADSVLQQSELALSFSKFTFTHEMIRTLLYEQLYRAFTLLKGKTYHY